MSKGMQYEWLKATTVQYGWFKATTVQQEAQAVWFQGIGWAKYFEVWACLTWVGRSECLNLLSSPLLSLCDSMESFLGSVHESSCFLGPKAATWQ